MRYFLLLLCIAHTQQVVLEDGTVMILDGSTNGKNGKKSCQGQVKIFHKGKWGYFGDTLWDNGTEEVVCKTTHCGKPVGSSTRDVFRPPDSTVWLNEVQCTGNETNLMNCKRPGWNISKYRKITVKEMKCSNEVQFKLSDRCSGAVQYVDAQKESGYICSDNWGNDEAAQLCQDQGCGTVKEIPKIPWMVFQGFRDTKRMRIKCSGSKNETNLWQCANGESDCDKPASVICQDYERLQLRGKASNVCVGQLEKEEDGQWKPLKQPINSKLGPKEWCQQMHCGTNVSHSTDASGTQLTCSENVEVGLMDRGMPSSCYGTVHVRVKDANMPVCASNWNKKSAGVVCRELGCGEVIDTYGDGREEAKLDNVTCLGSESSLWHCRAQHAQTTFQCSSNARVICANSVEVRVKDGHGKCAGRVEIRYNGQWWRISSLSWSPTNSDVVCNILGCGNAIKTAKSEKYSQGSGKFLTRQISCKPGAKSISECIGNPVAETPNSEAVGVTCEGNKVIYLKGDTSCSGNVWIEHGSAKYWLSGSNETWNEAVASVVCRQINCGLLQKYSASPSTNEMKPVLPMSYKCRSDANSLFDCDNITLPLNYNDTIANVTCTGELKLTLKNKCWGHVDACVGGLCGGVCADTWTHNKSLMLCQSLGCGSKVLPPNNPVRATTVTIKSVQIRKQSADLYKYNFVQYDDNDRSCFQNPAYVVCGGSIRPKIESRDYCSGNVKMYYEGQWLPVCSDALKEEKTQDLICKQLGCGKPVSPIDYFGPRVQSHVISQIQCTTRSKSIASCNITSERSKCTLGGLQCSKWAQMALHKGNPGACSGRVFAHQQGNEIWAVPNNGWTKTEGERLCKDLNCNTFKNLRGVSTDDPLWNKGFSCQNVTNPKNIWDCLQGVQSKSKTKQQLYIECQGEATVTLSQKCYGEVKLNNISVCGADWKYSDLVCQEMGCSNAISNSTQFLKKMQPESNQEYYHVLCEHYHSNIIQCKRFKGRCNERLVSVSCVDNVKFRFTQRVGGQIEVKYRDQWEKVYSKTSPVSPESKIYKMLCDEVGKYVHNETIQEKFKQSKIDTLLECSEDHDDLRHCVRYEPVQAGYAPARIDCDPNGNPEEEPNPVLIVTLGVVFSLVLIFLLIVFVRIYVFKRCRWLKNLPLTTISRKEESESGEYEDVNSKGGERMDFRLRSGSEMMMENDALSIPSLSYDEVEEAQPLTSKANSAVGNGSHHDEDTTADRLSDKDYDDVEAGPEVSQTHAEVHGSPKSAAERDTVAPPELVEGDDDYLVPGQDG